MPIKNQNPKGYDFQTMTFEIDGLPEPYRADGVTFKPPDPSQTNQMTKDGKLIKVKKVYHVKKAEIEPLPQIVPTPQPTKQYIPPQQQQPPPPQPFQDPIQQRTNQYIQPLQAQPPQNYQQTQPSYQQPQPSYQQPQPYYQAPQYNSSYNPQYPPQQLQNQQVPPNQQVPQQYYPSLPPIAQPPQPQPPQQPQNYQQYPPYYQNQPYYPHQHHQINNDHLHQTLPKLPAKRCECENCVPKRVYHTPPTPPPPPPPQPRKYDEYTQMTPKAPTPIKPHFNDNYDCHICQRCPTCAALHDNNHQANRKHSHSKQHKHTVRSPRKYETNFDDDDDEDMNANERYDKVDYYRNKNKISDAKISQYRTEQKQNARNSGSVSQRDVKNDDDEQHQFRPSCTCYECRAKRNYTSFNKHTRNDSTYGPPSPSEAKNYPPLSVNLPRRQSGNVKNTKKPPVEIASSDTYNGIPERDDDLWSIQTDPSDRELLKKLMK